MKEKRPRGRPKTGTARENSVQIRLTDAELTTIETAAQETPISTWMRNKALAAAKRTQK